jgi:hypothetical protein
LRFDGVDRPNEQRSGNERDVTAIG